MKKSIYHYFLVCFLAMGVSSCLFEDQGNYDYQEINDVTISGIDNKTAYKVVSFVDTLRITPGIECKLDQAADRFEYKWTILMTGGDDEKEEIIGTERSLNYPVALKVGNYSGLFRVYDKIADLQWIQVFQLSVTAITTEGWVLLCDEQGKTRIDIVHPADEMRNTIGRDVFDGGDLVGEPVSFEFIGGLTSNLYLNSTKSSMVLGYEDLSVSEASDLKYEFGMPPAQVDGRALSYVTTRNDKVFVLIDKKGDMYIRLERDDLYGFRSNHLANDDQYFEMAPYIGALQVKSSSKNNSVMLYDQTNKRFLELVNGAFLPRVMQYQSTNLWPSAETGRELVYMESTAQYVYAILRDPGTGGKTWLYGVELGENGKNTQKYFMEIPGAAAGQAKTFAFHSIYPYVFYASGENVYRFDYSVNKTDPVLNFPNCEIVKLNFSIYLGWIAYKPWETARQYNLNIAYNDKGLPTEKCGMLETYTVPELRGDLVLKQSSSNLGHIIDMVYKERRR